jgi:hypothetical protein
MPKQSFLEESARFTNIQYCFSIDGVGERFEYLRWPAKWPQVVENILWLVDTVPSNVIFAVNITISQLNKEYHAEILDWVQQTMPTNKQGRETPISYNRAGDDLLKRTYLDELDKKRNTNWKKLFPLAINNITS